MSGREPASQQLDIGKVKGWQTVVSSSSWTAIVLIRQLESVFRAKHYGRPARS